MKDKDKDSAAISLLGDSERWSWLLVSCHCEANIYPAASCNRKSKHNVIQCNRWRQSSLCWPPMFLVSLKFFFFLDVLSLWMFVVPPCLHLLFLTKLSPPDLSDQRGKKHYDWNKVGAAANTARCQNSRNRKSFNFLWGELPIMCRGCFLITAQPEKGSWQNLFRAFSRHNFGKLLIDVFNILRMKKILTHQPT